MFLDTHAAILLLMPGSQLPTTPHGFYNVQQIEQLWISSGGTIASAPMAAAIALAESGGNPNAIHHNANGTIDRGLWQINSVHGAQSTFDPGANVKAAIAISNNGSSWAPWSTFTSGAYKTFLTQAKDAVSGAAGASGPSTLNQVIDTPGNVVSAAGSAAGAVGSIAGFLTSPTNWLRIGEVIAGLILIAMGLRTLSGTTTTPITVATGAAKTAAKAAVL